ncbi:hypothetical protein, variant [Blastomyces dermatitidis ATCC 18188]|uniref:Uncharacterized protein n=1 Tax=Ajellomyces dermatitidis (strain ATCC 18188 / CBS 674.68) TaxID=653446 RepID=F2TBB9_AJEDA|nr:hypothetical protein BDDG_03447 [Blastomyces dermatitidis ATCC 18188]KMW67305.1 hypothetical protein, variant [Blastomyces dermatitidis ATCC 18188]
MSQKRRPRRLRTHAAGSKTIIGAKQPADSSPHDSQTPSKYLKVTKSMSRYSLQQTGECGLAVNDRTSGEEWEWSELVDESEWKEYEEIAASPTSEEKELGNRAMIKLDLFADIEWSKNARPIRTRRTEPDDGGGAGPSGSRRQSQEPPTRQTEQSSAEQHGSSCQDIHSMPGEPGEASQNSQPGVEGSSVIPSIEEPRFTTSTAKRLLMRIRTWAGENPLSKTNLRPRLSDKFPSFPFPTRPGRRKEALFLEDGVRRPRRAVTSSRPTAPTRASARLRQESASHRGRRTQH